MTQARDPNRRMGFMGLGVLCRAGSIGDDLSRATQRILELSVSELRCSWLGLFQVLLSTVTALRATLWICVVLELVCALHRLRKHSRNITWHDMAWHDMRWHYTTLDHITLPDMSSHDTTLHFMTWHSMAWHDSKSHYTTLHDMAWRDIAVHAMTWHGMTSH